MSQAIADLKHEHEAILFALKLLERMSQGLTAGELVATSDLVSIVDFLREFADRCHHGKEEGILFPALIEAGVSHQGGPIGVLLQEHVSGREWIAKLEASLHPVVSVVNFGMAARGYSALLLSHIQKENEVLFPIAEQALDAGKLDQIYQAFEVHEAKVIGQGRHEQLHELLQSLNSKYPAQRRSVDRGRLDPDTESLFTQ